MLPLIALSMSASAGFGLDFSSAVADMICPDWQYPHCGTSSVTQAAWIFLPSDVLPIASIVVTFLPATVDTGAMQERIAVPSTWTVQAPHSAMPQPNFVPVMLR